MEEVMNSIKHACELARNLEAELPNMVNHPDVLFMSIDGVVKAFGDAKQKVMMVLSQQDMTTTTTTTLTTPSSFAPMLLPHHDDDASIKQDTTTQQTQMGATSTTQMQDLMNQLLLMQQPFDVRTLLENKMISTGGDLHQMLRSTRGALRIGEMGGRDIVEGNSERSKGSEGEMQGVEASPSRPKKSRKNDLEKRTVMFPAPQVGNTEMPPEDGFTWRKYGQKEILGRKHPKSYYRCTHQKLYACPAKKQVQKLDDNPYIFEVTYRGEHTCHMSSTAPSSYPPPQVLLGDMSTQTTNISPQLSPSSTSVSGWLSSVNLCLGGGGAELSTSRYGPDNYPVADMADVMFNSGSSSGNSMESLFAPTEDKWEPGEKKN